MGSVQPGGGPHKAHNEGLRPYPIDSKQDKVVKSVNKLVDGLRKCSRAISSCFRPVSYIFSSISRPFKKTKEAHASEKVEEIRNIPLSFANTQKFAMDSKFYYTVQEGKIWYKPIAAQVNAPWKEFGNNGGYADDAHTPISAISADGDNVVVVDNNNHVHYAKSHSVNVKVNFDNGDWESTADSKVNWTTKWFNMNLVAPIVNKFKDPTLTIDNVRSFGVSHKGTDAMYYTDMAGKKHPDPVIGVTTLYVLSADGTQYFFADPWLHNQFQNELTGPEDGQFVAENMAVSASTLFVIQRARDENGKEIHKMYTRYADFDSIGSNPALPITYDIDNKTPLVRFLPAEDWTKQPEIPLEGQARLTKEIFVLQTGRGQDHRQLRVIGTNSQGQTGYYYKNIYEDQEWKFEVTDQQIDPNQFLAEDIPHTGFQKGPEIAHDYKGDLEIGPKGISSIELTKFAERGLNERGLHTKVEVTLDDGRKLEFPLYARRGFRHLLGFDGSSKKLYWTLVVPKELRTSKDPSVKALLKGLFNNKKAMAVHVEESTSGITITPELFLRNKFKMQFPKNRQGG